MGGLVRITPDDPRIFAHHPVAIRRPSPDPIVANGIVDVERLRLDWPRGTARVSLWLEDVGEWENLPHPLQRRVRVNGHDVVYDQLTPNNGSPGAIWLAGTARPRRKTTPGWLRGRYRGGLVSDRCRRRQTTASRSSSPVTARRRRSCPRWSSSRPDNVRARRGSSLAPPVDDRELSFHANETCRPRPAFRRRVVRPCALARLGHAGKRRETRVRGRRPRRPRATRRVDRRAGTRWAGAQPRSLRRPAAARSHRGRLRTCSCERTSCCAAIPAPCQFPPTNRVATSHGRARRRREAGRLSRRDHARCGQDDHRPAGSRGAAGRSPRSGQSGRVLSRGGPASDLVRATRGDRGRQLGCDLATLSRFGVLGDAPGLATPNREGLSTFFRRHATRGLRAGVASPWLAYAPLKTMLWTRARTPRRKISRPR